MHKNLVTFGRAVFELCVRTDRQTDTQTRQTDYNTWQRYQGEATTNSQLLLYRRAPINNIACQQPANCTNMTRMCPVTATARHGFRDIHSTAQVSRCQRRWFQAIPLIAATPSSRYTACSSIRSLARCEKPTGRSQTIWLAGYDFLWELSVAIWGQGRQVTSGQSQQRQIANATRTNWDNN